MKRFFHFFIFSLLLSACATAVTPTATATNTLLPTVTSTITPVPTITPTVEPEITDIPAWLDERTQYWVDKLGHSSYQELLDGTVMKVYKKELDSVYTVDGYLNQTATSQAFVTEVILMPDNTLVAVAAFPNSDQLGLVNLGGRRTVNLCQ